MDRPGSSSASFSVEMLEEMLLELDRLLTKYSGPAWTTKSTANRIVTLLTEHRALLQIEINEASSGMRKLTEKDFLGPKERKRRRRAKLQENIHGEYSANHKHEDYSEYFIALQRSIFEEKRRRARQIAKYTYERMW